MNRLPILCAGLALLSACAANSSGPTPKATVLTLETGLTAADKLAMNYITLPHCGGTTSICSDPAIIAQIKAKAQTAYNGVTAAQSAVDADPSASASATSAAISDATAALAAFKAVIPATTTVGN